MWKIRVNTGWRTEKDSMGKWEVLGYHREEETWEGDFIKLFMNSWAQMKLSRLGLILISLPKTLRT